MSDGIGQRQAFAAIHVDHEVIAVPGGEMFILGIQHLVE